MKLLKKIIMLHGLRNSVMQIVSKNVEYDYCFLLEYACVTWCVESATFPVAFVMGLDSMLHPSSPTNTFVSADAIANEIDINTATIDANGASNSVNKINDTSSVNVSS